MKKLLKYPVIFVRKVLHTAIDHILEDRLPERRKSLVEGTWGRKKPSCSGVARKPVWLRDDQMQVWTKMGLRMQLMA